MTVIKTRMFGMLCEVAGKIALACSVVGASMEQAEHWAALRKRGAQ